MPERYKEQAGQELDRKRSHAETTEAEIQDGFLG